MLDSLPRDWRQATLLGRLLTIAGPTPILICRGRVLDVSGFAATTAEFATRWRGQTDVPGKELGDLEALPVRRAWECDEGALPRLLTSERLGTLENRVTHCEHAPPWTVGITALMLSLARRGLLQSK